MNYPALLALTHPLRAGRVPASTTRFGETDVSTGSAVSTGGDSECPTPTPRLVSLLDGTGPSGSARLLSRSNATRVCRLRRERVVPFGTTSESRPTGRNGHVDRPSGVQWNKLGVCAHGLGTDRATQLMTALYRHPALLAPVCRSVRTGAERLETAKEPRFQP
ncbi:MAG: hypothetical protein A07HR60_01455 [uncultured archaeon A07HR60]|nr:MAG: hypothetical protein A07HR60_01455 [uncultured archaeon A07HR60]